MSDTPIVPIDLLEAVNMLLDSVRLAQVNSLLPSDMDEAAGDAVRTLGLTSRSIQMKGWYFNTLDDYSLSPDTLTKEIVVPANFTLVLPNKATPRGDIQFTKRGNKLFDKLKNTYEWTQTLKVRVVQALEFDELPEPFRWYVTAKAGRTFGLPRQPDSLTFRFSAEVVKEAQETAETFDALEGGADLPRQNAHMGFMIRKR